MAIHHYIPLFHDPADFRTVWFSVCWDRFHSLRDCVAYHPDPADAEYLQIHSPLRFLAWALSPRSMVQTRPILVVSNPIR